MSTSTLIAGPLSKMGRAQLAQIPVPQATRTHRPVPHHEIVDALVETLCDEFRLERRLDVQHRSRFRRLDLIGTIGT